MARPNILLSFRINKTKEPKQDSQIQQRLPFPGEENISFINVSPHHYHCHVLTTK
jgi:hypothetical protein